MRRPRSGSTRPRALRSRAWTPPRPAGPGVAVLIEVEASRGSGEVHEIRRGKNGVTYCTCPSWTFSPAPKTCKHLARYEADLAANPLGSGSNPLAGAPVPKVVPPPPSPLDRALGLVRGMAAPGTSEAHLRSMATALLPHLSAAPEPAPVAPVPGRRRLFLDEE